MPVFGVESTNGVRRFVSPSLAIDSFPKGERIMSFYRQIESAFQQAGARVNLRPIVPHSARGDHRPMAIDIAVDGAGEYFDIRLSSDVSLAAIDVQPQERHLLLAAWNERGEDRFLCGHDEFHWFAAALPTEPSVRTVDAAKEALKPDQVQRLQQRKHQGAFFRRSDVYLRQGEWFFVPCRHASIDAGCVVQAENCSAVRAASRTGVTTCTRTA
jgi:hypothetical protein